MAFLLHDWDTGQIEGILPQEYFSYTSKTKTMDPDSPPWHVVMRSEQIEEWIKAAESELADLETRKAWTEIHKDSLPPRVNVLPGIWALKIKRFPDGRF